MNNKLPISCFIIAQDEADRIANTIESVIDIVDEVIVIDSGSTDGTQDLARQVVVSFQSVERLWSASDFGEDCAKNEWLLNLGTDEYLSDQIKSEILQIFDDNNNHYNFFSMKVTPIYPNRKDQGFSLHRMNVRLYNKRFEDFQIPVHDQLKQTDSKIFCFASSYFIIILLDHLSI